MTRSLFMPLSFVLAVVGALVNGKCARTDNLNDCAALQLLYSSVTFQNGTRLPWKMDGSTSLCSWKGVYCTSERVNELSLLWPDFTGPSRLAGTLPDEIALLSNLSTLRLMTLMSGTIPSKISGLPQLTVLDLSDSTFSGTIPSEIGRLSSLVSLELGDMDSLSGTIPSEIGGMLNLENIFLTSRFSGSIPSELGRLSKLGALYLTGGGGGRGNHLTGLIPEQICPLVVKFMPDHCDLERNSFTCPLPTCGKICNATCK